MVEGARPARVGQVPRRAYTLRSLFFVSLFAAVPFLLLANIRSQSRPDDSLASPLYLAVGVAAVLIAAAIGNAAGRTVGLFVLAGAAGLTWVTLVAVCSEFSHTLRTLLPVHIAAATATVLGLVAIVRRHRETGGEGTHEMLVQLLKVKESVRCRETNSEADDKGEADDEGE
jgi:hypothetical protein